MKETEGRGRGKEREKGYLDRMDDEKGSKERRERRGEEEKTEKRNRDRKGRKRRRKDKDINRRTGRDEIKVKHRRMKSNKRLYCAGETTREENEHSIIFYKTARP